MISEMSDKNTPLSSPSLPNKNKKEKGKKRAKNGKRK
jgi:hypothetical protein